MTWAKLDDTFFTSPKAVAAGPLGCVLYVAGLTYCNRHLTDGYIPAEVVAQLVPNLRRPQALSRRLVAVGLWKPTPSGFEVDGFLSWNERGDDIRAERARRREQDRERQRRWRQARATRDLDQETNAPRNAVTERVTEPDVVTLSRPLSHPPDSDADSDASPRRRTKSTTPGLRKQPRKPGHAPGQSSSDLEAQQQRFDAFWAAFPKRASQGQGTKTEARAAWLTLQPTEEETAAMCRVLAECDPAGFYDHTGEVVVTPAEWLGAWREAQARGLDDPLDVLA